jgi:hypothetical protein
LGRVARLRQVERGGMFHERPSMYWALHFDAQRDVRPAHEIPAELVGFRPGTSLAF